ncbi:DUF4912 domain-containing protein [Singulisphaera sp. PoT]|uniref:DUF4912 domain-containing protein n=1 Tax=Singulisphaera sp. PoT TaxID=3411797 RepID=UPI003BF4A92F
MTVETLKDCNKKYLAQLAKDQGIVGWHAMRKDQLIRALSVPPPAAKKSTKKTASTVKPVEKPETVSAGSRKAAAPASPSRPLTVVPPRALDHGCVKDRIIAMVRDPYWLHAYWELSRSTLARAQAALGQEWHTARPILRVVDVTSEDTTSASERHVRDIEIHGGVNNWYIDVATPPRSFRIDIGYVARRGKFFVLARSNVVSTPKAGSSDVLDENWASVQEQFQKIYSQSGGNSNGQGTNDLRDLFEERLRRPMQSLSLQSLGTGALAALGREFHFELDAELIVYGTTEPNARVTLSGEPVQLRPDGTFTVRFSLPDSRQIIPAVAASPDGVEERTIVLAVERNTKELEPMIHDGNEL